MDTAYIDVLKRLKEERQRLNLSQSDMGKLVPMSQGNYSKIELGQRRLSFYEMQYLCRTEADIHYIFTGQKCLRGKEEILTRSSYSELISYLGVIYSIAVPRREKSAEAHWNQVFDRLRYVPLIIENRQSDNLFFMLRRYMGYQQLRMAKEMGIDVKTLRELENGRSLPDSELLYRLYVFFHVPPFAPLRDRGSLISEISILLETMDAESRKEIVKFLTALRIADE